MLTISENIYRCTREQAQFVAECADLRHVVTSIVPEKYTCYPHYYGDVYDLWEDKQTAGGGCRIVWADGMAWISRHSGYAWADITGDVAALFKELGCVPQNWKYYAYNPQVYSTDRWLYDESTNWQKKLPSLEGED